MPSPVLSHAQRLRTGRFSEPGRIYLLTTTVYRRMPLFRDFDLGRLLVAELRAAHEQGWVSSLAWVVMPDHLHWLVRLEGHSLDTLMRGVKSNSSRLINRRLGRAGPLWQDGYHDRALRRDEDLQVAARYVVANPLRAGLVERLGDYPHWDAVWLLGFGMCRLSELFAAKAPPTGRWWRTVSWVYGLGGRGLGRDALPLLGIGFQSQPCGQSLQPCIFAPWKLP